MREEERSVELIDDRRFRSEFFSIKFPRLFSTKILNFTLQNRRLKRSTTLSINPTNMHASVGRKGQEGGVQCDH